MKDGKTLKNTGRKMRPALNREARENQMISLAVDLAEKQLRDGSASAQVISHYLKMGSERERLERKRIEGEIKLQDAKTESLRSQEELKELYAEALIAMKKYSGNGEDDEY